MREENDLMLSLRADREVEVVRDRQQLRVRRSQLHGEISDFLYAFSAIVPLRGLESALVRETEQGERVVVVDAELPAEVGLVFTVDGADFEHVRVLRGNLHQVLQALALALRLRQGTQVVEVDQPGFLSLVELGDRFFSQHNDFRAREERLGPHGLLPRPALSALSALPVLPVLPAEGEVEAALGIAEVLLVALLELLLVPGPENVEKAVEKAEPVRAHVLPAEVLGLVPLLLVLLEGALVLASTVLYVVVVLLLLLLVAEHLVGRVDLRKFFHGALLLGQVLDLVWVEFASQPLIRLLDGRLVCILVYAQCLVVVLRSQRIQQEHGQHEADEQCVPSSKGH